MTQTLQVRILNSRFGTEWELPSYATPGSAALDLRAALDEPLTVEPGMTSLVPSGLSVYVADPSLCAMILPRSGTGHKQGMVLGNGTGLIDSDYQGPLMISVFNRSQQAFTIAPGDRIAQLVIVPVVQVALQVVDSFELSQRGQGGFGHTGKN